MPRILLVAATTGYQTRSFAEAARRQGFEVALATDRCHILEDPWLDNAVPVRFDDPAAIDIEGICGIVAVADRPTLVAALTAEKLGIPFHPPSAVKLCRDKHAMRSAFAQAGLLAPWHFRVPLEGDVTAAAARADYPCVLKPLDLSASRGVIRANHPADFAAAFERIRKILQQAGREETKAIQVEAYIEGREFALEGLMTAGALQVLALFDKPDPLEGPFFEETLYVTPSREPAAIQNAIVESTRRAVAALGLWHGPVHAEMRVNETGVYMLEIAARPIGGLCARALRFETGPPHEERLTLEDLVILHAAGEMPGAPSAKSLKLNPPATGVMMIPIPKNGIFHATTGVEDARRVPGIDDVLITAIPGQKLTRLPEGAGYPGFLFASGNDPASVEHSLRLAHGRLGFEIFSTLHVVSV